MKTDANRFLAINAICFVYARRLQFIDLIFGRENICQVLTPP